MVRKMRPLLIGFLVAGVSLSAQAQKLKTKDFSGWMGSYETLVYDQVRNAFLFSNVSKRP